MRPGHRVIHQRTGQKLTVLVVDHFFVQRLRNTLNESAVHLTFNE